VGWLEGSLRLLPGWETRAFGHEIPNPFFSGVLLPSITFALLYAWPFLEARFTRDRDEHHLLDRPRDRPVRTAIGIAALAFYTVLFVAGGNDVLAAQFEVSVNLITNILRVALFALPAVAGYVTYRLCKELAARGPAAGESEPPPGGELIVRTEDGGYVEVEEPVGPSRS
jgi:ubiquinol-cytochrome c reductase cytochrome b subunit